jgi:hypothetical protein
MTTVEIREVATDANTNEPQVVTAGTLVYEDGMVKFKGCDPKLVSMLQRFRFPDTDTGEFLTYEDGERWLKLLPYHLRGTYLSAADLDRETFNPPSDPDQGPPGFDEPPDAAA